MITYLLISLLAVLIFLSMPDFVQVMAQAASESGKANHLSKKHLAK
jgi:hypothetical protein